MSTCLSALDVGSQCRLVFLRYSGLWGPSLNISLSSRSIVCGGVSKQRAPGPNTQFAPWETFPQGKRGSVQPLRASLKKHFILPCTRYWNLRAAGFFGVMWAVESKPKYAHRAHATLFRWHFKAQGARSQHLVSSMRCMLAGLP